MCVYNNCSLGIYYMQCVFTTTVLWVFIICNVCLQQRFFGYLLHAMCVYNNCSLGIYYMHCVLLSTVIWCMFSHEFNSPMK